MGKTEPASLGCNPRPPQLLLWPVKRRSSFQHFFSCADGAKNNVYPMLNVKNVDTSVSHPYSEMEFVAKLVMAYLLIAFRAGVILASECSVFSQRQLWPSSLILIAAIG